MPTQEKLFKEQRNYWTPDERRIIELAQNQVTILNDAIEQAKPWQKIAEITLRQIIPGLLNLQSPDLSSDKQEKIANLVLQLHKSIPDNFEIKKQN